MHTVAILAYDGMTGFESGLAAEIFGMAELPGRFSAGVAPAGYAVKLCSEEPEIRMLGGAVVRTSYGIEDLATADTLLIPSVRDVEQVPTDDLLDAIRAADARGARLVSICSGAFALAAAGVLDGRTATTHWIYADLLAQRYPAIEVDPAPLYIDNGRVLTSAGCAAGLDLCLHIVRADHGVRVANDVARRLVISPHRAGGQAQYIETPIPEPAVDGRIAAGMRGRWNIWTDPSPSTNSPSGRRCPGAATCASSPRPPGPRPSNGLSSNASRPASRCWNPRTSASNRSPRGSASNHR